MKNDRGWLPGEREADWIESLSRPLSGALAAIEAAATEGAERIPIVDRDSGRVLAALAAGRRRIVEVGTAFGYSTLWLAMGQPADGTIVTIDPDRVADGPRPGLVARGRDRRRADHGRQRARRSRRSRPAEPALAGPFDLAFIDALKPEYEAYLEALVPRLAPGALVVADNVLWSGRVVDPAADGAGHERAPGVRRRGPRGSAVPGDDPAGRRRAPRRRLPSA